MLVVTVEVWPGGRAEYRRTIGEMYLGNVSDLAEVSNYAGELDGEPITVERHTRSKGAWELVRKALNKYV